MDREKFWQIVRHRADFILQHHKELVHEQGEEYANEALADAIMASNMATRGSAALPIETVLDAALQHTAFCCAACLLDLENENVQDIQIITLPFDDTAARSN